MMAMHLLKPPGRQPLPIGRWLVGWLAALRWLLLSQQAFSKG